MLRIREVQLEALSAAVIAQLIRRLAAELANVIPDADERRHVVESSLDHAQMLGIEREDDLRRYVLLRSELGAALDTPRVEALLRDDLLPFDERLDEVERLLRRAR